MYSRSNSRIVCRFVQCVLVGLLLVGIGGCGSSNPFDMVSVSGKVAYEDGSPFTAHRVSIMFSPQVEALDKKSNPRPGWATVDVTDGTFSSATTLYQNDGLIAGKHTVQVLESDEAGQERELEVKPSEIEVSSSSKVFEFTVKKQ